MVKKKLKIYGEEFFPIKTFPLAVVRIDRNNATKNESNYTFVEHTHNFSEIELITAGSGVQCIDNIDYPVTCGDIYIIQGKQSHYYKNCDNLCLFDILFDEKRLPLPWDSFRKMPGYNMIFHTEPNTRAHTKFADHLHADSNQLPQLISRTLAICKALGNTDGSAETEATIHFLELILDISRTCERDYRERESSFSRINAVISRMENEFVRDFSLEELARHACTSSRNFLRQFKKATNTTPINYVLQLRLHYASTLLLHRDMPITEIAYVCGFKDSNYFSRQFSLKYKLSPRLYRRTHIGGKGKL